MACSDASENYPDFWFSSPDLEPVSTLPQSAETFLDSKMNQLPQTDHPLVLRTDYSDQAAWENICVEISKPVEDFYA